MIAIIPHAKGILDLAALVTAAPVGGFILDPEEVFTVALGEGFIQAQGEGSTRGRAGGCTQARVVAFIPGQVGGSIPGREVEPTVALRAPTTLAHIEALGARVPLACLGHSG